MIGWGVAAGAFPVHRTPGEARVSILDDGSVEVESSSIDMGTGTYTILAQTAADAIGLSRWRTSRCGSATRGCLARRCPADRNWRT